MNGMSALQSLWNAKFGLFGSLLTVVMFVAMCADVTGLVNLPPVVFYAAFGSILSLTLSMAVTLGRIGYQDDGTDNFFNQVRWYAEYLRHHQATVYRPFRPRTWLPMSPGMAFDRHRECRVAQMRRAAARGGRPIDR